MYVIPGYEDKMLRYYLLTEGSARSTDIIQALRPMTWEDLQPALLADDPGAMYVILPAITPAGKEHLESLQRIGFTVLVEPEVNWNHARFLLARER